MNKKDFNPFSYYKSTETVEARLHRLISLRLRNIMATMAYYNKDRPECHGLFEICDPSEEADMLIDDLRFFGFLPPAEPSAERESGGVKDGRN